MTTFEPIHQRIETWFGEALSAVEPRGAVNRALAYDGAALLVEGQSVPVAKHARLIVIALGKAAEAMASGAVDVLGSRIDHGIVLTKDGHVDGVIPGFDVFEASHPMPDERGLEATRNILQAVEGLSPDDIVLALVSGGGSALLELPRDPLTLGDLQQTTRRLMHAGAGIHDLNAVRSVLSRVKGGGLRRSIGPAHCVSLLLSDVLGNDPAVIASGPTIQNTPSPSAAREILSRFGVIDDLSPSILAMLEEEDGDGFDERPEEVDIWSVIADNQTLVQELARQVADDDLSVQIAWHDYAGDAAELGRLLVHDAEMADMGIDVLVGGGEATVEVRGDGAGGRNTEAALAAAIELADNAQTKWCIASLASDGDDGTADAAGAIADPETIARGHERDFDAKAFLSNNDSATYFRETGGLVAPGPTGTNVNDLYIAVRLDSFSVRTET